MHELEKKKPHMHRIEANQYMICNESSENGQTEIATCFRKAPQ